MARAKNKDELLQHSEDNFSKLFALIDTMSADEQEKTFAFEDRDKNIRDVLVHLYEWHQLLIHWITSNRAGDNQPFLPAPYTWKTYGEMNVAFWEKHQATPYQQAKEQLQNSHRTAMTLIDEFSNDELFTKKYFSWTGTTSLGSYCISSMASHYDWALKKIRKHKKNL